MKYFFACMFLLLTGNTMTYGQTFSEILGRPTNSAITMSILFDQPAEVYWEYGTSAGSYPMSTPTYSAVPDSALEADFSGLAADTKYFYRTRCRPMGSTAAFSAGAGRSFHTLRPVGSTFSFAIEADPHLDTNSNTSAYALTLQNVLSKSPDFLFDLGDIFMSEKLAVKNQANITGRHLIYRPFFGATCHSVPLFLVIGNHEGENGWSIDGTPNCLPVLAANTRKLFYPNPYPNSFYTGNIKPEPYVGLRENYYSFEWGNTLFIVLDPYWYTITKPGWGWTLGQDQYNWFKNVITTSQARFKFVFCHQLVGGYGNDGRGGSEYAGFYEQGGENTDLTWGFSQNRPGWQKTVHELMVENNADIFFHGHDHCYAKQDMNGMVYQEVPQPSSRNITNFTGSQYGYVNGTLLPSRGFLLVTVTDSTARIDYVKTFLPNEETGGHVNGEIADSYTIRKTVSAVADNSGNPSSPRLDQNFPNPFNSETTIRYKLPAPCNVQLKIFDMTGREIQALANGFQQAGTYSVSFSPEKLSNAGGVYYCSFTAGNFSKTIKLICIQ